jgi:hypothetical protein
LGAPRCAHDQTSEAIELLDEIVDRPPPVMANRVAGLLSQLFRYGIHRQVVESSAAQLLFRPGGTERPLDRRQAIGTHRSPLVCYGGFGPSVSI